MKVSLLVAMDEERGIGRLNALPWRLSSDLRRFKSLTMGHHILMGRKTFESIGMPLPGRTMVVITRNPHYQTEDALIVYSLEEALALARNSGEEEVFVIGGAQIFAAALPIANRIYLTRVHANTGADTFFPHLKESDWLAVSFESFPADENNEHPFTFELLERA